MIQRRGWLNGTNIITLLLLLSNTVLARAQISLLMSRFWWYMSTIAQDSDTDLDSDGGT